MSTVEDRGESAANTGTHRRVPSYTGTTALFNEEGGIPLVLRGNGSHTVEELCGWISDHRPFLVAKILENGAVLLRGFPMHTADDFRSIASAVSSDIITYSERSSPRKEVAAQVYTSTEYPASEAIFPHNEHSYCVTYPLRLFFGCILPAKAGGATPLVPMRRVKARISEHTREHFRKFGYMYVRNFGDGLGLPWQVAFQTSDRCEVEKYCRNMAISVEWKSDDRLRTRQVRPVFVTHPRTGEQLWFNHATFFHVSTLDPVAREVLSSEFDEDELPNNTYYGDGQAIEPEVLDELRSAYMSEVVSFPWERGDMLILDNVLTAHSRQPYVGPRKILVSMAEPITRTDIWTGSGNPNQT